MIAVAVDGSEICGALLVADPLDACLPLRYGFRSNETDITRFALVERGECTFEDKVQHAQNAGFRAVIVYDNRREKLVHSESPRPLKFPLKFLFTSVIFVLLDFILGSSYVVEDCIESTLSCYNL